VFDGQPAVNATARQPEGLLTGCNKFLKNLDVTFRRDPNSFRPRINKANSQMDQEQKLAGNYVSAHEHQVLPNVLLTQPAQFFLEDDS
jgi:ATP-binding cassette subfamily E protein 1